MKYFTFLLLVFTTFFSNFLYADPPPVSMYRGNSELTGVLEGQSSVNKLNGVKFIFETKGAIRSNPAIANGIIYFGSTDGYFYAIDAKNGEEKWKFKTNGAVSSSPSIGNNTVWFSSRDGYLYSVDALTGKELWKFELGQDLNNHNLWDFYLSSPNIVDEVLYIGSADGNLYAIDITSKNDFIDAFIGKNPNKKINWIGAFGDLKSFIKYSISENLIEKVSTKWIYTTNLFTYKNNEITNSSLNNAKITTNDSNIKKIVKSIL